MLYDVISSDDFWPPPMTSDACRVPPMKPDAFRRWPEPRFKSESMSAPGRCATLKFQWNLASLKGLPQNSKWQTGSLSRSLWWEIAHPTGLITFFSNKSALITDKSRKPSGQQFLTFYLEGLYIYWYIISKCKDVSFSQFDWQLVNYWPWIWDHLFSHSNIWWFWDQISLLARKL